MDKYIKRFYIYGFIVGSIGALLVLLDFFGVTNFAYNGFAVDGSDLLYVGKYDRIDVYRDGEYMRTVFEKDGWYAFTILDEKLRIAAETDVISVMDLSGNLVERISGNTQSEIERLDRNRDTFLQGDTKYLSTNRLGYYKITKYSGSESEVVYHIPALDYFCDILFTAIFISIPVFLITTCPPWFRAAQAELRNKRK